MTQKDEDGSYRCLCNGGILMQGETTKTTGRLVLELLHNLGMFHPLMLEEVYATIVQELVLRRNEPCENDYTFEQYIEAIAALAFGSYSYQYSSKGGADGKTEVVRR